MYLKEIINRLNIKTFFINIRGSFQTEALEHNTVHFKTFKT